MLYIYLYYLHKLTNLMELHKYKNEKIISINNICFAVFAKDSSDR